MAKRKLNLRKIKQKRKRQYHRKGINVEKYKELKKQVLKRDGFKCRWRGCQCNVNLEMHHITKWSQAFHLRYAPGNCIILCKEHHKMVTGKEEEYAEILYKLLKITRIT